MNGRTWTWWWGTNRPNGMYYAGRVHVVHPNQRRTGLCGLPVGDVWELRPPMPEHLCPDCCVLAMAASYPPFSAQTQLPTRPTRSDDTDWFDPVLPSPSAPDSRSSNVLCR